MPAKTRETHIELWPLRLNQEMFFVFGTFNYVEGASRVPAVHYALGWCQVHEELELNIDISNMQEDSHNGDFF
jgi:hypothetical protein